MTGSGRDGAPDGVHLWLVLWKAYEAVRAYALRNIESLQLGFSDFAILEVLLHKGCLPVGEIGARVGLTSGAMTSALDRLENKGLLARGSGPDRRTRHITLTESGRELIQCAFGRHAAAMNELVGTALEDDERAAVEDALKRLGKAASARVNARE